MKKLFFVATMLLGNVAHADADGADIMDGFILCSQTQLDQVQSYVTALRPSDSTDAGAQLAYRTLWSERLTRYCAVGPRGYPRASATEDLPRSTHERLNGMRASSDGDTIYLFPASYINWGIVQEEGFFTGNKKRFATLENLFTKMK